MWFVQLRTAASCLALAAIAVWMRTLQSKLVLTPLGVVPVDADSFYHFRRIGWTVRNFPAFLSVDPYINFPHGGEPIWSPTFDFVLAALVRVVIGVDQDDAMERLLCWIPVIVGVFHVLLLFVLGRRFLSESAAFGGALFLAVLPAHENYSQVGFVDHHAVVSLVGSLVMFAALQFADRPGRATAFRLGLSFAGAILVWPGCLIHVAVAEAALLGFCLSRSQDSEAMGVAQRLAAAHFVATMLVAPLCLGRTWIRWGSVSPLVLSNFQPLWLGAGAVSFATLAIVWRRAGFPRGVALRSVQALAVGACVAALLFSIFPDFARTSAADAWSWLARDEEFQAVVMESLPLVWWNGELQIWYAAMSLSGGFLLAPLAAGILIWRQRVEGRPELGILAVWSIAFITLALANRRFGVDAAPALALLLPAAVDVGMTAVPRSGRFPLAAGAIAVGLVLCVPILYWHELRSTTDGPRARAMMLTMSAANWLRANSPPTESWRAPGPAPAYGVLTPWGVGHTVRYIAQRPMVQDNFGDDVGVEGFAAAEAYFSARTEAAGAAILERMGVRYVLVGRTGSGHGTRYASDSMLARLLRTGNARGRRTSPLDPPLVRHRLVYASKPLRPLGREPYWKIFELTPSSPQEVSRAGP